jgi:peptide methionine sulfoxide reductase msrA/msrB
MSKLTELQKKVVFECATEPPFQNEYWNEKREGIYVDVLSNKPIFASIHKFDSGTGWPSFYETISPDEIEEKEDLSHFLIRTEVRTKAGTHLGHLFLDGPEGKRYCLNSASIRFIARENMLSEGFGEFLKLFSKNETIVLAGGCFWGMEHMLLLLDGVVKTRAGYCGGFTEKPTYKEVSTGKTGHAESVEVSFNPNDLTLENLLKYFFQIHDPTTINRQGNDVGSQYRSAIFYYTSEQRIIAENVRLKAELSGVFGGEITTEISEVIKFWEAEEEHQKYLIKNPMGYNCHFLRKEWKF